MRLAVLVVVGLVALSPLISAVQVERGSIGLANDPAYLQSEATVRSILSAMSEGMLTEYIQTLQDFRTRYCYTPACLDSAGYIHSQFEACGLATSYQDFSEWMGGYRMVNVIGELAGTNPNSSAYVIICAHYDSYSSDVNFSAPGADDNGSGTAAVIAAARLLSHYRFNMTIRFIAFSGEEEGLYGSSWYAEKADLAGDDIAGVLNMDMIATEFDPSDSDVLMYSDYNSEPFANFVSAIHVKYQTLICSPPRKIVNPSIGWSDHYPFWSAGYPALLFIEEDFSLDYHMPTDTIGKLNLTYAVGVTRLVLASACELAGLNSGDVVPPRVTGETPSDCGCSNATPVISVEFSDASGINVTTAVLRVNGFAVACSAVPIQLGSRLEFRPSVGFADGATVACSAVASDGAGNAATAWWNFTADASLPLPPSDVSASLYWTGADKVSASVLVESSGPEAWGVGGPSVMADAGLLRMWYTGAGYSDDRRIYMATADNDYFWTKQGLAIDMGSYPESDYQGASQCDVVRNGEYKMWYAGYDGFVERIMYANSTDGSSWTKRGVVLSNGTGWDRDSRGACAPSVVAGPSGYTMWYSGWDGGAWGILRAVSTDGLSWTKMGVCVERGGAWDTDRFGASDPEVIQYGAGYMMLYTAYDGDTTRVMEAISEDGIEWTKLGLTVLPGAPGDWDSRSVSQPSVIDVNGWIHIYYAGKADDGRTRVLMSGKIPGETVKSDVLVKWEPSPSLDVECYRVRVASSLAELSNGGGDNYTTGTTAIIIEDAGDENPEDLYMKVAAVDRAGHVTEGWQVFAKLAVQIDGGWSLLGNSLAGGPVPITEALESVAWDYAMGYDSSDYADHWKTNSTARLDAMDDLSRVEAWRGMWTRTGAGERFCPCGAVANLSVPLKAGWNLVAMPYIRAMAAGLIQADIGPSCTIIEGFDPAADYRMRPLGLADSMEPGRAYWIYVTSDTIWHADNYI